LLSYSASELLGLGVPHPLDAREHTQEALLDWHSCHGHVSVLARIPSIVVLSQEASLGLLGDHRRQLDLVIGELGLGNDVADAPHHEEAAPDSGVEEMLDVVTIAQVASMAPRNALGGSDVCLVTSGARGLGHCELIDTGDVPEAVVHVARLGIGQGATEIIGRGQEDVPLGAAEELLVAREVSGVHLFAPDKVKVGDVIRDHVGGVGSGHDGWGLGCFVLSALDGCFNW